LNGGCVAIGIIGRIVPVKNYALFTEVAGNILLQTNTAVKFFVIGDGTEKQHVQRAMDKLGIPWCNENELAPAAPVIFTSWMPDVSCALHGLDIIVLTSHNEGTPMSLIEAQYCGKPVAATDVGGVKDTFLPGESGFLVPPGNAGAFTSKLLALITNSALRTAMGSRAAIFAQANFSKAKEIDSFRSLYNTCSK
jgi:glycosyltransferase involved in cell wall biosynthesis